MISFPFLFIAVAAGFFLIGIVVVLLVFFRLFFSSSRVSDPLHCDHAPGVGTADFFRAISHMTNALTGRGGDITIIKNGDDFLEAILDGIEGATKSINITTYVWEAGKATEAIGNLLAAKAKAGVPVRMLLDRVGSFGQSKSELEMMSDAGVTVRYFRGIRPDRLVRIHRRSHRRAIIIDGDLGYTGGIGLSDRWFFDTKEYGKCWRDLTFRVEGVLVPALQNTFAELWVNSAGEALSGDVFYPDESFATNEKKGRNEKYAKHNAEERPFVHLSSSPSIDIHPFSKFLWFSANAATETLYITTPYFVPNRSFHTGLQERAKSGVDVRLIVPSEKNINRKFVRWAAGSYYWSLLESGVRIFEYEPCMIHTKLLIADGTWSVFGSGNVDFRSFELNEENVFGIQDETLAKNLTEVFEEDLAHSKEILLSEWKRRGLWARIREHLVLLFAKQF